MATVNEKMTAICDAIREKTGGTEPLTLDAMAQEIPNVYNAGYEKGKSEGGGNSVGANDVWEIVQGGGTLKNYDYKFTGAVINPQTFKPPYPIKPTSANQMFANATNPTKEEFNLADIGVDVDFSNCTGFQYACSNSAVALIGTMNVTKCSAGGVSRTFQGSKLRRIERFITAENVTSYYQAFLNAKYLEHMIVEGVINTAEFSVSSSTLLDKESLLSIINCLKDYSVESDGKTHKLVLGSTNIAKLSTEELQIIEDKGWIYA